MRFFQLFFILLLCFLAVESKAQVAEPKPNNPNPSPRRKTTTPTAPQTLPLTGDAGLLVMVDFPATLYVDGLRIGDFDKGSSWPYKIMAGTHIIQLKTDEDQWDTSVVCTSKVQLTVFTSLKRVVDKRLVQEENARRQRLEQERRKKEYQAKIEREAEEKRQREEAERIQREERLKKEAEQKRLAALERQRYLDSMAAVKAEKERIAEQRRKDSIAAAELRAKQIQDSLDLIAKQLVEIEKRRKEIAEAIARRKAQRMAELKKAKVPKPELIVEFEWSMVVISGGEFKMGCTSDQIRDCEADERPIRNVSVADFKLSKFEVTQELWEAVMDTNVSAHPNCAKCPVENIRYGDVQVFISKLNTFTGKNYRLPTEAEWEYAARGGNKAETMVPALSDMAWYGVNSGNETHEVGQLKPNALGLYDMLGNVWEYCADWYDPAYYSGQQLSNPKGPSSGAEYVIRGGSYFSSANECRVANRNSVFPIMSHKSYGFRLAE